MATRYSPVIVDWRGLSLHKSATSYDACSNETCYGHIPASNKENDGEGSFDRAEDRTDQDQKIGKRWADKSDTPVQRDYDQVAKIRSAIHRELLSTSVEGLFEGYDGHEAH